MSIRITMDKLAATILTYDCTSIHHANANETGRTESSKSAMERCELSRRCGLAFIPAHSMRCGIAGKLSRLPVASLGWPSFRHRANLTFSQSRKRCPSQAVFCLLTALVFHRLTTQIPHAVEVALPRTARVPRLDHPPIKVFRFSSESLNVGIETHTLDGVSIRVYCREKTLADVFKYRNKVGLDVALEALRAYRSQPKRDFQAVLKYARICRVENVIRPYLEATL